MGQILMIIGGILMLIAGIGSLVKKEPDAEKAKQMKKSGIICIVAGIVIVIISFIF